MSKEKIPESTNEAGLSPVDKILADYWIRIERGEIIDREVFLAQHADHAAEIQKFFEDEDAFNCMISSQTDRAQPNDVHPPLDVIRYFGDYVLLEEIGHGGMGVVYKAMQKSLNRTVAVKMILAGRFVSQKYIDRFRQEAQAVAQLKHRGIVNIHEVGEHNGHHYFSMDFIDGQNLSQMVQDNAFSPRVAVKYMKQISDAIEYAHQRGILHRDLKPANILIGPDDTPVVTDFGLAKQIESESDLTVGGLIGSPSYMSPEQAEGATESVGVTSDVYSLGATLYHLLTGRPPFRADSPSATVYQVVHSEPVSPRLLNSSIDRDLETICLKSIEKEPSRRYMTAGALADDLDRYSRGKPIVARPISRLTRLWRWGKREPVIAALVAAVTALLVSIAVAGPIVAIHEASLRREAENARKQADVNYSRVFSIVEAVNREVGALNTEIMKDNQFNDETLKQFQRDLFDVVRSQLQEFNREQGGDARSENELARTVLLHGRVSDKLGDAVGAAVAFEQAKDVLEDLVARGEDSDDVLTDLSNAYERLGMLIGTSDPYTNDKSGNQSKVEKRKYWHSLALKLRQQIAQRHPQDEDFKKGITYSLVNLATAHSDGEEHQKAFVLLEEAFSTQDSLVKTDPTNLKAKEFLAVICQNLAEVSWRSSRFMDAVKYQRKHCDVRESLAQSDPTPQRMRTLAASLENLAERQFAARDVAKDQLGKIPESLRAAAKIYEPLLEDALRESSAVVDLRIRLAHIYIRLNESLSLQENALAPEILHQRLNWIRKARDVAMPVIEPDAKDGGRTALLAKEIVDYCDETAPDIERALQESRQ
ncbi:MAG: serine/threonine protein kinase [Pirellulales bacterium]|nr:serine/threonine protein kinase [Pirellulales bacterium]